MVRNITHFAFTYFIGNVLIALSVVTICIYSIHHLITSGHGENIMMINTDHGDKIFSTIGYTIYIFEGIGLVMPIMQACETPEQFDVIFKKAVTTIFFLILANGVINYVAFGDKVA